MEPATIAPKSLSGKWTTIVLMIILLGTGGLFYWVTTAYTAYNAARRQAERDWREVASQLDTRYRRIDQAIASEVQAGRVNQETSERWHAGREVFSGTALPKNQIEAAQKVEQVLKDLPPEVRNVASPSSELQERLATYKAAAQQQREIGRHTGSQLLKTMLNLPDPLDLELSQ